MAPPTSGTQYATAGRVLLSSVKVVRETITSGLAGAAGGAAAPTAICPPRPSTGTFLGGGPAGVIPAPRPGLLPGTFIGPTLVFPGVLNPGIPTTIPVASVPVATAGLSSQVQVTATSTTMATTIGTDMSGGTGSFIP